MSFDFAFTIHGTQVFHLWNKRSAWFTCLSSPVSDKSDNNQNILWAFLNCDDNDTTVCAVNDMYGNAESNDEIDSSVTA